MCVCDGVCAHEYNCVQKHEKALGLLELELQVVVSHLIWVLEARFQSYGRRVCTHNYWGISPDSEMLELREMHAVSFVIIGMFSWSHHPIVSLPRKAKLKIRAISSQCCKQRFKFRDIALVYFMLFWHSILTRENTEKKVYLAHTSMPWSIIEKSQGRVSRRKLVEGTEN